MLAQPDDVHIGDGAVFVSSFFRTKGVSTRSFVHSETTIIKNTLLPAQGSACRELPSLEQWER